MPLELRDVFTACEQQEQTMTDHDVIATVFADGFTLEERVARLTGAWAWGWIAQWGIKCSTGSADT